MSWCFFKDKRKRDSEEIPVVKTLGDYQNGKPLRKNSFFCRIENLLRLIIGRIS